MAINSITITQDNKINGSDLLPIHSPLAFIVDVNYTGEYPTSILLDIIDENSDVLDTFRAIPYKDTLANVRQFVFQADDIRGLMSDLDDEIQLLDTLVYVNNATKTFTLKFRDPDNDLTFDETTVTFVHGAAQFSESPNLESIYNNDPSIWCGAQGGYVYTYFYNEDEGNVLTINSPSAGLEPAQDYDDEVFVDFDDTVFTIDITG